MSSTYRQTIFVNLPVADLPASLAFYAALGFVQNKTFSDDKAAMVSIPSSAIDDAKAAHTSPIKVMLLSRPRFGDFVPEGRTLADAHTTTQVLLCLSMESRDRLDEFIGRVAEAGGVVDVRKPMGSNTEGVCMYGRSFADLDGHLWETVWMDPKGYEGKE